MLKDVRPKIIKVLEQNIEPKFHNVAFGSVSLDTIPKDQQQEITDRLNFIKMQSFCASKDTIKEMKREHIEWKEISANHILIKDYYPECMVVVV